MKGDFTRSTFDRGKHYSGVRMQQGRVQVDADWNEQVDIESYRDQTTAEDIIGPIGVPEQDGTYPGFKIGLAASGSDLTIGAGRIYINGLLCENEQVANYLNQPDLNPTSGSLISGRYLVYVDVWQRHVTAIEDESIKEIALGGPDTGTRTKTVWQVKVLPVPSGGQIDCDSQIGDFDQLSNKSLFGKLQARATPAAVNDPNTPCVLQPNAGFVGLENQLYRVEIHNPGSYFKADSTHPSPPTFKWSRENGAIVVAIEQIAGNQVKISSLGKDAVNSFKVGDYIEILNDSREINGLPGDIKQITAIIESQRILTLDSNVDTVTFTEAGNPKVRRWESVGGTMTTSGIMVQRPDANEGYLPLENGVEVLFGDGLYHTGDYWLIPARTDNGSVEWPVSNGVPVAQTRQGIEHSFGRLALATYTSGTSTWSSLTDCRKKIVSLTDYPSDFYYVGGDGQEGLPSLQIARPLQVGVANSQYAVKGARIKYSITAGSGSIAVDSGFTGLPISGGLIVFTNNQGIASCTFTLDGSTASQQVTAVLVDDTNTPLQLPPVRFNAAISAASGVSYTPPQSCTTLTHVSTVQDALDQLCSNGSGDCNTTIKVVDIHFMNGPRLTYGLTQPFPMLGPGIRITFDTEIDPKTITQLGFQFYLYLPFMFGCGPCTTTWYGGSDVSDTIGYTSLLLDSTLTLDNASKSVLWQPKPSAFQRLMNVMTQASFPASVRMLSRLVLKGNFIWDLQTMSTFLGGKLLPTPTGYKFPIEDDCAIANDIEVPFWLTPAPTSTGSGKITWISVDIPDLPCNGVTVIHAYFDQPLPAGTVVPLDVQITGDQSIYRNPNTNQSTPFELTAQAGNNGEAIAQFAPSVPSVNTTVQFSSNFGGGFASTVMRVYPCSTVQGCVIKTPIPADGLPGGSLLTIEYTLTYPFQVATAVQFQSSAPNIIPSFDIVFPAQQTVVQQQVQTLVFDNQIPVSVTLSASTIAGNSCPAVLMKPRQSVAVTGLSLSQYDFTPSTGVNNGLGTIQIDRPAPTGGVDVTISVTKGYVVAPVMVHIDAGASSANFPFTVQDVGVLQTDTLKASYNTSSTPFVTVTIHPAGRPLLNVQDVKIGMFDGNQLIGQTFTITDVNVTPVIPNNCNAIQVTFNLPPDASSVHLQTFLVYLNGVSLGTQTAVQIVALTPYTYVFYRPNMQPFAAATYPYIVNLIGTHGGSGNQPAITYNTTLLDGNAKPGTTGIPSGDGTEGGTFSFSFKVGTQGA